MRSSILYTLYSILFALYALCSMLYDFYKVSYGLTGLILEVLAALKIDNWEFGDLFVKVF